MRKKKIYAFVHSVLCDELDVGVEMFDKEWEAQKRFNEYVKDISETMPDRRTKREVIRRYKGSDEMRINMGEDMKIVAFIRRKSFDFGSEAEEGEIIKLDIPPITDKKEEDNE